MRDDTLVKVTQRIGLVEVANDLEESLRLQFDEVKSSSRARRYKDVGESKSIEVVYDPKCPGSLLPVPRVEFQDLWIKTLPLRKLIRDIYGAGYVARCIFTQLNPGATIHPHLDPGLGFSIPHRIHWVVSTNSATFFDVDGQRFHLSVGEVWEINNKKVHSVRNEGETSRIHFVVDYVRAQDRAAHGCWNFKIEDDERRLMQYWFERERSSKD